VGAQPLQGQGLRSKDLAKGLLKPVGRAAAFAVGHAFPPDSEWQKEFEESFEYQETDDQLRSIGTR
jgi:transcription-repair coupling factor (superfamily II helicase)